MQIGGDAADPEGLCLLFLTGSKIKKTRWGKYSGVYDPLAPSVFLILLFQMCFSIIIETKDMLIQLQCSNFVMIICGFK